MINIDELIKQAKLGDPTAQYKLGRAFENGEGVEKDIEIAVSWYKKAASNGNQSAKSKLLLMDINDDSNSESFSQITIEDSFMIEEKRDYIAPQTPGPLYGGNALDAENSKSLKFETETEISKNRKIIAIILAIFFGIVGAHDFYLGYTKRGIIKIVLTITCIGVYVTGVWVVVDIICILINKMKDRKGNI